MSATGLNLHTVVPAAYLYLRRGDEVLLQHRGEGVFLAGHWAAGAAGHLEMGELPRDAVLREAQEELGITVHPDDLQAAFTAFCASPTRFGRDQRVDVIFTATRWTGEPAIQEAHKATDLAWWPLADLPDDLSPYEAPFLAHLRRGGGQPLLEITYSTADWVKKVSDPGSTVSP